MEDDINHAERAHSKFSASGSERWLKCAASVELEEASPPSADSFWSKEGTLAHEVLECILNRKPLPTSFDVTPEMVAHAMKVVNKIRAIHKAFGGVLLIEKRVYATFIHPEMFGTCDAIIADNEGTLHIIDFKYGAGHVVDVEENTQLIQYALSAAESYGWQFDTVKMWIMQPRAGDPWFKSWSIPMTELQTKWLPLWHSGVKRVLKGGNKPFPGGHCHWCRAKNTCPAKQEKRAQKVSNVFENNPIESEGMNGLKEKSGQAKTAQEKSRKKESKKIFEGEAKSFGVQGQIEDEESFY